MAEPARIRVLAREVAEGIAAGEVINRPAAVVKELLENSLDAGATRISVELEQGGIDRIRVVDDGGGMDAADLALALLPHATSKLRALDDLRSLETFGFRGEALASIAAAAAVDVLSRVGDAGPGMRARAALGQPPEIAPGAAAPGTVIEVTGLFAGTPARRAFLRSPRVEGQACLRVAADVALSRPEVALSVRVDGRRALSTPGRGGLEAAAAAVLGRSAATRLLPVDWSSGAMTVVGVAGEPELARADRQALVVMVNGRRVHQRSLNAAAAAP
ncbi:MAG: DNA mismatch repair endonuclease MutL, partial [Candidatus Dormibacteria bacterium]